MQDYLKPYVKRAGLIAGAIGGVPVLITVIPILGPLLLYFTWPVVLLAYIGAGVLAGVWGKKQGVAPTIHQGAMDGAIAGVMAGVIVGIVIGIVDIWREVLFGMIFGVIGAREALGGLVGVVVGGFIVIVLASIFAAILGAIGGLSFAAIQQRQKKTTS